MKEKNHSTTEPKPERKTKDSYIRFRCTEDEKQAIELEAEKHHLSVSAYILSKLLG